MIGPGSVDLLLKFRMEIVYVDMGPSTAVQLNARLLYRLHTQQWSYSSSYFKS